MNKLELIEDLIPQSLQNEIKDIIFCNNFPWYYNEGIWGKKIDKIPFWQYSAMENPKVTDSYGFSHLFCEYGNVMSAYFPLTKNILSALEKKLNIQVEDIIRIRARLTTQILNHNENKYSAPHFDFAEISDYYTLVYYVNDSDGDTILFKESIEQLNKQKITNPNVLARVTPKQGMGLFFKGNIYHSGNFPINFLNRVIINFDFTIK